MEGELREKKKTTALDAWMDRPWQKARINIYKETCTRSGEMFCHAKCRSGAKKEKHISSLRLCMRPPINKLLLLRTMRRG